jgi:hypothetical protein
VGVCNYIWLPARDGPIPVLTVRSLSSFTGTVHTITASLPDSPLAIESLLQSLLETLLETLLERAAFERATLREE